MPLGYIDFKWVLRSVLRGPWLCAYDMCLCIFCREKLKFAFDSERKCNWEKQEPATWELNGVREHDNTWTGRTNGIQLSPLLCVCVHMHAHVLTHALKPWKTGRVNDGLSFWNPSLYTTNMYGNERVLKSFRKKKLSQVPSFPSFLLTWLKWVGSTNFSNTAEDGGEELWGPSSC